MRAILMAAILMTTNGDHHRRFNRPWRGRRISPLCGPPALRGSHRMSAGAGRGVTTDDQPLARPRRRMPPRDWQDRPGIDVVWNNWNLW